MRRKPRIAVLATGDELVMPGEPMGPNQIVSSNNLGLRAFVEESGAEAIDLGIALDTEESLETLAAGAKGADMLVTIGGVSVGDHDLVRTVLGDMGLDVDFWRIAMRPGKPLMFGRLGETAMLGLPGNPVSALVCGLIFLRPAIARMLGLGETSARRGKAELGRDVAANDCREDYLRATLARDESGALIATPFEDPGLEHVVPPGPRRLSDRPRPSRARSAAGNAGGHHSPEPAGAGLPHSGPPPSRPLPRQGGRGVTTPSPPLAHFFDAALDFRREPN